MSNDQRQHMDCMPGDCLVARTLGNPDIPCPINKPERTPDMVATRLFWVWLDDHWETQGGVAENFMDGMDDWVEDATLTRDETLEQFAALNPTPSEPGTLHRDVSRMVSGLILFHGRINTKADVRQTADKLAGEVIETVYADLRQRIDETLWQRGVEGAWNNALLAVLDLLETGGGDE